MCVWGGVYKGSRSIVIGFKGSKERSTIYVKKKKVSELSDIKAAALRQRMAFWLLREPATAGFHCVPLKVKTRVEFMEVKYGLQSHPAGAVAQVTQLIQHSHTYLHMRRNESETGVLRRCLLVQKKGKTETGMTWRLCVPCS